MTMLTYPLAIQPLLDGLRIRITYDPLTFHHTLPDFCLQIPIKDIQEEIREVLNPDIEYDGIILLNKNYTYLESIYPWFKYKDFKTPRLVITHQYKKGQTTRKRFQSNNEQNNSDLIFFLPTYFIEDIDEYATLAQTVGIHLKGYNIYPLDDKTMDRIKGFPEGPSWLSPIISLFCSL